MLKVYKRFIYHIAVKYIIKILKKITNVLKLQTFFNEQSLERCQMLMLQIRGVKCRGREHTLKNNVIQNLSFMLQDVKTEFSKTCSVYVKCK